LGSLRLMLEVSGLVVSLALPAVCFGTLIMMSFSSSEAEGGVEPAARDGDRGLHRHAVLHRSSDLAIARPSYRLASCGSGSLSFSAHSSVLEPTDQRGETASLTAWIARPLRFAYAPMRSGPCIRKSSRDFAGPGRTRPRTGSLPKASGRLAETFSSTAELTVMTTLPFFCPESTYL
jgi:hypothetical protein